MPHEIERKRARGFRPLLFFLTAAPPSGAGTRASPWRGGSLHPRVCVTAKDRDTHSSAQEHCGYEGSARVMQARGKGRLRTRERFKTSSQDGGTSRGPPTKRRRPAAPSAARPESSDSFASAARDTAAAIARKYDRKASQHNQRVIIPRNIRRVEGLTQAVRARVQSTCRDVPFLAFTRGVSARAPAHPSDRKTYSVHLHRPPFTEPEADVSLFIDPIRSTDGKGARLMRLPPATSYVTINRNMRVKDDRTLRPAAYLKTGAEQVRVDTTRSNGDPNSASTDEDPVPSGDERLDNVLVQACKAHGDSDGVFSALIPLLGFSASSLRRRHKRLSGGQAAARAAQKKMLSTTGLDRGAVSSEAEPAVSSASSGEPDPASTVGYEKMFCRRCFVYHCTAHGTAQPRRKTIKLYGQQTDQEGGASAASSLVDDTTPRKNPCGSNCFLHTPYWSLLAVALASGPRQFLSPLDSNGDNGPDDAFAPHANPARETMAYKAFSGSDQPQAAAEAALRRIGSRDRTNASRATWTKAEQSLFRKAFYVCGPNYCKISAMVGTRTCAQVFAHARQVLDQSPGGVLPIDPDLPSLGNGSASSDSKKQPRRRGSRMTIVRRSTGRLRRTRRNRLISINVARDLPRQHRPCHHPGEPCTKENCSCVQAEVFCEKFCACARGCANRFPGCTCRALRCATNACPCFAANRECDPDLCGQCTPGGAFRGPRGCCNMDIQSLKHKPLLLAPSAVHGWGAFSQGFVAKGELVSEYVGEVISQEEADRRGQLYDQHNRSYLFNLNEDFVVDAARKGCKIKFANHSDKPNTFPCVRLVRGDHRIGIYASRDIYPGEEIVFRYSHEHCGGIPEWYSRAESPSVATPGTVDGSTGVSAPAPAVAPSLLTPAPAPVRES